MSEEERFVIGVDSSTQSVKAIAWRKDGTPAAEGRASLSIDQPQPLYAEQDARTWWTATAKALRKVTAEINPSRIDGIAISNQRETMVFVDEAGEPLAPATLWLDSRAHEMMAPMSADFGGDRLHRISGKPVDIIPCVYRLAWYRRHQPELLDRTHTILDVHGYLTRKLTGDAKAAWTSGDPFGIFDIEEKQWSEPILNHLNIPLSKLPSAFQTGTEIGRVTAAAAAETGLPEGLPVFAGGGDGHCAGLGVGAISEGIVYLNLGTAIAAGLWSATPEISKYWRTLISPTGEGYLLETVQRGGAFFVNWFIDNFAGGRDDPAIFRKLETAASNIAVGSQGVAVCSYLVGCMDPHWDHNARASFVGMGPEHTTAHLYRACLEAITLEFSRALDEMRKAGASPQKILAIGGGADSLLWRKMVADSTGVPVSRSLSNEASALGAGIAAAVGAGWFDGFAAAVGAMTSVAETITPDRNAEAEWKALSQRQAEVYLANSKISRVNI